MIAAGAFPFHAAFWAGLMAYGNFLRASASCALLFSASILVAGCQSKSAKLDDADELSTASTGAGPSFTKTAALGDRWKADPKNVEVALAYADGLGQLGQADQQLQVLQSSSARNPGDNQLKSAYGKALLKSGQASEAVAALEAATSQGADWKAQSALGSAYDQNGDHAKARTAYEKALTMKPNDVSVLNNMGMSYALEGDLKKAETTLRTAMGQPESKSMPKIRQNLALIVGLQGRYDESREIASKDLPPDEVDANLGYLQKMLAQPNTWQQLSQGQPG
jgi:Flp pilus assembly protein TadD